MIFCTLYTQRSVRSIRQLASMKDEDRRLVTGTQPWPLQIYYNIFMLWHINGLVHYVDLFCKMNKSNVFFLSGLYSYRHRVHVITVVTQKIRIRVDKSTVQIILFLPQYQHKRKVLSRARAWKGIAWHIDVGSVIWTFINNGKLANQIAKFVAVVVKNPFLKAWSGIWCL